MYVIEVVMLLIINDLSTKTYVLSKTKTANIKVFNMETRKNGAKILTFHVIVNVNSINQYVTPIKNRIMVNVNVGVKYIKCAKEIIVGILAYALVRIAGI